MKHITRFLFGLLIMACTLACVLVFALVMLAIAAFSKTAALVVAILIICIGVYLHGKDFEKHINGDE